MDIDDIFIRRKAAYDNTFKNTNGKRVLADLKRFCRVVTPSADINNPYATYMAEGRREVWLRIQSHLNLTDEEVYLLTEED